MTLRSNIPILLLLGFTFTTLLTPVTATHKVNDKCTNKKYFNTLGCSKSECQVGTLPPPITHFPQLLIHSFINSHSSNASKNPTATTHISGEYKKPVKICSVRMELVIRIFRIWIVLPKMGERREGEREREREGEEEEEEEEGGMKEGRRKMDVLEWSVW
ncbi:uncharacterized protein SEPMUDRAFT_107814 [Sphaerulina musiva SO2202]|uniref:Uncharacterized protein n=1 Tax=Sphaerulina musiva (strain SO2202) TaxID=692275 RepID=M3CJ86_SPHMS|nr:uncharacterized protein SEPMUDRAFT_107814 [Sphaerulina musiva SO2202]EMF13858.1 hypothetical protein SEPMUDRAFT_107814 [Sphaerulina musiva SO2202]